MTTQTQTVAAFVLASFSVETGLQVAKALAQAVASNATALQKAERDLLASTRKAALLLSGQHLTAEHWTKQLAQPVRKALEAKVSSASIASALSRAKVITLATLARPVPFEGDAASPKVPHWSDPLSGETSNAYVKRVGPLLDTEKLPDGSWIMPHEADGSLSPRKGAKRKEDGADTKGNDTNDVETGHDVSRGHAAAVSLMGSEDGGKLLLAILSSHRAAFMAWAQSTVDHSTVVEPTAPEPTPEDVTAGQQLNKKLLDMANAKGRKSLNGAAN